MEFTIRIANKSILIHSVYPEIYRKCQDYLAEEHTKPDIEIHTTKEMLEAEFEKARQSGESIESSRSLERFLIHQLIAEALPGFNSFLMHGAVIAVENVSFMFSARSGTGKTTHILKWIENIPDSYVVNGDKPVVMINEEGAFACGTPWCGKEGFGTNTIIPLRSIVFMVRSTENHIEPISFKTAFPLLLGQTYCPTEPVKMQMTFNLLARLKENVSFYRFSFNNFKEDAFQVAYDALVNNKG